MTCFACVVSRLLQDTYNKYSTHLLRNEFQKHGEAKEAEDTVDGLNVTFL